MLEGSVSPYAVLADQTGAVGADTAEGAQILASPFLVSIFDSIQASSKFHSRCRLDRSSGDCSRVNTPFAGALAVPIERREIPVSLVALFRDSAWCGRAVSTYLRGRLYQTLS
jgi:hypothetical protein